MTEEEEECGLYTPSVYWDNYKRVEAKAAKFKTISQWQDGHRASYVAAARNKWLDKIRLVVFSKTKRVPPGYWTKENVFKSTEGFESFTRWRDVSRGGGGCRTQERVVGRSKKHLEGARW